MKSLYQVIEGAGHIKNRLGGGSSGTAYDIGNGKIRKTLRVKNDSESADRWGRVSYSPRRADAIAIEKWSKVKKGLRVIPYITDVDYDGYTIDKFQTPCKEGDLIVKAVNNYLFTSQSTLWKPDKIEKLKKDFGEKDAEWVMNWLKDFEHDYELIMGTDCNYADDIRSANIGKDKHGNVMCFDWFDPFCF